MKKFVIVGASSVIAQALCQHILNQHSDIQIIAVSQHLLSINLPASIFKAIQIDYQQQHCWQLLSQQIESPIHGIVIANGLLHNEYWQPEKSLSALCYDQLQQSFEANVIVPALAAQSLIPLLDRQAPSFLAFLSARAGSISENHVGGWYSYRCCKSALNMMIKNISIELRRTCKNTVVLGLNPGAVHSPLSQPFINKIPSDHIFSAEKAAQHIWAVIQSKNTNDSGKVFDWDSSEIPF